VAAGYEYNVQCIVPNCLEFVTMVGNMLPSGETEEIKRAERSNYPSLDRVAGVSLAPGECYPNQIAFTSNWPNCSCCYAQRETNGVTVNRFVWAPGTDIPVWKLAKKNSAPNQPEDDGGVLSGTSFGMWLGLTCRLIVTPSI